MRTVTYTVQSDVTLDLQYLSPIILVIGHPPLYVDPTLINQ